MSTSKVDKPGWLRAALDRHEPSLLRYATRLTGDAETARDVVQDTFLRLWQADEAELTARVPEWLFVVCRNKALDLKRRESRWRRARAEREEELGRPQGRSPIEELERRQVLSRVLELLDELPPQQAEVIRLRFRDGLSYREIAVKRGLSVSNVGFLIHVGMRSLRARLEGGSDGS